MELETRISLLTVALFAGGVYAAFRIVLTLVYPVLVNIVWQGMIGPIVAERFPSLVQNEDNNRFSYLPAPDSADPFVLTYNFSPNIDDLTQGLRDGIALGVLVALLPEFYDALLLAAILVLVLVHGVWVIFIKDGSYKTDASFMLIRRILMWLGVIAAVYYAGIIP